MGNLLYRMRCWLERFMYGRNGTDPLNLGLVVLYVVLVVLQAILAILFPFELISTFFSALLLLTAFFILFRTFSKNLEKRRRENTAFLNWWMPKRHAWRAWRSRVRDKDHKYFKCRSCGACCRVPRGKGRIEITCPRCHSTIIGRS